jgi:hypothetical protein
MSAADDKYASVSVPASIITLQNSSSATSDGNLSSPQRDPTLAVEDATPATEIGRIVASVEESEVLCWRSQTACPQGRAWTHRLESGEARSLKFPDF